MNINWWNKLVIISSNLILWHSLPFHLRVNWWLAQQTHRILDRYYQKRTQYEWSGWPWHCQWCCGRSCILSLEVLRTKGEAERKKDSREIMYQGLSVLTIHMIVILALKSVKLSIVTFSGATWEHAIHKYT